MHNIDYQLIRSAEAVSEHFHLNIFHEQLPLPVPCYDLTLVTKLTLGPAKCGDFGYSRLPWLDGR